MWQASEFKLQHTGESLSVLMFNKAWLAMQRYDLGERAWSQRKRLCKWSNVSFVRRFLTSDVHHLFLSGSGCKSSGARVSWPANRQEQKRKFIQEQLWDRWVKVSLVVMVLMVGFLWEEGSEFSGSSLGKGLVSLMALQGEWGLARKARNGQRDPDAEVASEDFECLLFQSSEDAKSPFLCCPFVIPTDNHILLWEARDSLEWAGPRKGLMQVWPILTYLLLSFHLITYVSPLPFCPSESFSHPLLLGLIAVHFKLGLYQFIFLSVLPNAFDGFCKFLDACLFSCHCHFVLVLANSTESFMFAKC